MQIGIQIKLIALPQHLWEAGIPNENIPSLARIVSELEDIERRARKGVANRDLEVRRVALCLERLQDAAARMEGAESVRVMVLPNARNHIDIKSSLARVINNANSPQEQKQEAIHLLNRSFCPPRDTSKLCLIYEAAANSGITIDAGHLSFLQAVQNGCGLIEVFTFQ